MAKKDQKAKLSVVHPPEPEQSRAEEYLANWVEDYGVKILYAIGGATLLVAIIAVWGMSGGNDTVEDFLVAQEAFERFNGTPPGETNPSENPEYLKLKAILEADPSLATRYNGPLAQTFLRLGDMPLALFYGQKALNALAREDLPFYEDFSKTSLLIADGDYKTAVQRAEFLHKNMLESDPHLDRSEAERGFGDTLFLCNALRLATLQQRLGNAQEELRRWQELATLIEENDLDNKDGLRLNNETIAQVKAAFKTGKVAFNDYIGARTQNLRQ